MIRISDYWYLSVFGRQPEGPYQEKDIIKSLKDGNLSWAVFACNPAIDMPWKRLIDVEHFREFLPKEPTLNLYQELHSDFKEKTRDVAHAMGTPGVGEKWFLQCNGSQFGPMNVDEVRLLMKQTSFKTKMFAWKQGQKGWMPADQIPELKSLTDKINAANSSEGSNRRKTKRVKLLASITLSVEDDRIDDIQGICRDISLGGLFIVTHDLLPLNTAVKVYVSPVSNMEIKPFQAEGFIVSVGREEIGMAIQFTNLPTSAKADLETYIKTIA